MPPSLGTLTDLRTMDISIVSKFVNKHVRTLEDLLMLNTLEGSLTIHMNMKSHILLEANTTNLKKMEKLKKLSINFKYGIREDEIILEGLQPHEYLCALNLTGYEGEKPSKFVVYWFT